MSRRNVILAAVGLAIIVVVAGESSVGAEKAGGLQLSVEKHTLRNGLRVILREDHSSPLVAVNLLFSVGSGSETPGHSGLAHFFEHMAFQGSLHITKADQDTLVPSIGGREDAQTWFDWTTYYALASSNQLETLLWLRSDQVGFLLPLLDQKMLDAQRKVILNERRQRRAVPYGEATTRMVELLFPKPHPYHDLILGSEEDIHATILDDARGFYRQHYGPSNGILAIVGDIQPKDALALAEKYFGSLPASDKGPRTVAFPPPQHKTEISEELVDRVSLPQISFGWVGPPAFAAGDPELDIVHFILTGTPATVLERILVHERKLAQSVNCEYRSAAMGSIFTCDVVVREGVPIDRIKHEFDAVLDRLRSTGPTAEEVDYGRTAWRSAALHQLEGRIDLARTLCEYEHYVGDANYVTRDFARHDAVSAESIRNVIRDVLAPTKRVVLTVKPLPKS